MQFRRLRPAPTPQAREPSRTGDRSRGQQRCSPRGPAERTDIPVQRQHRLTFEALLWQVGMAVGTVNELVFSPWRHIQGTPRALLRSPEAGLPVLARMFIGLRQRLTGANEEVDNQAWQRQNSNHERNASICTTMSRVRARISRKVQSDHTQPQARDENRCDQRQNGHHLRQDLCEAGQSRCWWTPCRIAGAIGTPKPPGHRAP